MKELSGNRASRRLEAKFKRHEKLRKLKAYQEEAYIKRKDGDVKHVENRVAKSQKKAEERWLFRLKIGQEKGVNPKRVILTSKVIKGEATYVIK